ncbi:hypothetical protein [Peptoniphilus timonensis]|uniref:hypothetical protein n=1 Tax=Peptoniphilus timonensis TaxID=1268254 RepID=UPI000302EE14|nr:hypothetical protein [Peptoniphilus timonensis]
MGELILSKKQEIVENKEYYLRVLMYSIIILGLFAFLQTCFASGGTLDTSQAMEKGKGLFSSVAEVLGTFFIIIGGIMAIWGLYTVGMAIKDGVSGQTGQSLTAIIGGILMAVAGYLMKNNGDKLFDTN